MRLTLKRSLMVSTVTPAERLQLRYFLRQRKPALISEEASSFKILEKILGKEPLSERLRREAEFFKDKSWGLNYQIYPYGAIKPGTYSSSLSGSIRITKYETLDQVSVTVHETPLPDGSVRKEIWSKGNFFLPKELRSKTGDLGLRLVNAALHEPHDSPGRRSVSSLHNLHAIPNSWAMGSSTLATRIGSAGSNWFNQKQREETDSLRRKIELEGFGRRDRRFDVYVSQIERSPNIKQLETLWSKHHSDLLTRLPAERLDRRKRIFLDQKARIRYVEDYLLVASVNDRELGRIKLGADEAFGLKDTWAHHIITPEQVVAASVRFRKATPDLPISEDLTGADAVSFL